MRKLSAFAATILLAAISVSAQADLAVVQVGDGSAALASAATATFVKQFGNEGGPAYNTIALPTAVSGLNQPVTLSGTSTSEGFLTKSVTGNYLTIGGYIATPGSASPTGGTNNRVIGRIDLLTNTVDSSTRLGDGTNLGNIRSTVSNSGGEFWAATSSGGIRYLTFGSTGATTQISATLANTRVVNIASGQLYTSAASGAFQGLATVGSGLSTTSGQTTTIVPGFPTAAGPSAYDYWFADANTVYVADDRASTAGGIQKWTLSAGTWSLQYTLATGTNIGARGLAGEIVGSTPVLYATTAEGSANRLITIMDTGAGSAFTLLATAPANTAFRGVELFAAVPESSLVGGVGVALIGLCGAWAKWRKPRA